MPSGSSHSVRVFYPKLGRSDVIRRLAERLPALQAWLPLVRVVLFGSFAKGNYTVASDVDLLVVYRGAPLADAYAMVKEVFDLPRVEPHLYTEEEYEAMRETLAKMTAGGVVLYPQKG